MCNVCDSVVLVCCCVVLFCCGVIVVLQCCVALLFVSVLLFVFVRSVLRVLLFVYGVLSVL